MIDKKQLAIGIIVGLIVPVIAFMLWVILFTKYEVLEAVDLVRTGGLYSSVLSLSAIANMGVLYFFLNKNKIFISRGILLITIFLAFIVLITKF